jgi:hypothetical protein
MKNFRIRVQLGTSQLLRSLQEGRFSREAVQQAAERAMLDGAPANEQDRLDEAVVALTDRKLARNSTAHWKRVLAAIPDEGLERL